MRRPRLRRSKYIAHAVRRTARGIPSPNPTLIPRALLRQDEGAGALSDVVAAAGSERDAVVDDDDDSAFMLPLPLLLLLLLLLLLAILVDGVGVNLSRSR